MSRIRQLIQEIHRRSLWQVLAIYLVGAWLAYQVIVTLWESLKLPEWVPGAAIVLFLIGLPIVLATAFVQEGIGAGSGSSDPGSRTPAATPPPVRRGVLTWRNALAGGVLAFAGLGAITSVAMIVRTVGDAPEAAALDANAVAVLPFRVSGSPELAYLREGMVDLLVAKFTGEGGPRAVDQRTVLRAWRAAVGPGDEDLPHEAARTLTRSLGAGMLILGDVVGTAAQVTLHAALHSTQAPEPVANVSVAGPVDSILSLIDRLAAELLSRQAGEDLQRLSALTSASLPALQAYLTGQIAYRSGQFATAARHFRRATEIDSAFALAGLMLAQAKGWDGFGPDFERGRRIAWAGKDRLSPRDREMVIAFMGENYPDPTPQRLRLEAWERLAQREPRLPEVWYGLGDEYFHRGEALGFSDAPERAQDAFHRALDLDSMYAPAVRHLADLAAFRSDTLALRRISTRYFHLAPEERDQDYLGLTAARRLGDSAWIRRMHERFDSLSQNDVHMIVRTASMGQLPYEDGVRAAELIRHRSGLPDWQGRRWVPFDFYADAGQPEKALEIARANARAQGNEPAAPFAAIDLALWWDGDEALATAAATTLEERAGSESGPDRFYALLQLANWRLHRGDLPGGRALIREVPREAPDSASVANRFWYDLIRTMVATQLATAERAPDLAARAAHLDSLLTRGLISQFWTPMGNLVAADAHMAAGDPQRALTALRRRPLYGLLRPATLLMEARIAAQIGDHNAAIRAYQEYLTLRPHPEPGRPREQVEAARRELAALVAERG